MKYLLDTNICIHLFRGKLELLEKINSVGLANCAISEITLAELIFGAENSKYPTKNHNLINKLTSQISVLPIYESIPLYGKEKVRLRKNGKMISDFDLLIGCTAVYQNMIMVTENVSEFERINKVKIENWVIRN